MIQDETFTCGCGKVFGDPASQGACAASHERPLPPVVDGAWDAYDVLAALVDLATERPIDYERRERPPMEAASPPRWREDRGDASQLIETDDGRRWRVTVEPVADDEEAQP